MLSIPTVIFSIADPPGMHVPHFVPEHVDWFPRSRSGTGAHMTYVEKFGRTGHTMLMFCGTFNIYQRLCSVALARHSEEWKQNSAPQYFDTCPCSEALDSRRKQCYHNPKRVTCPSPPALGSETDAAPSRETSNPKRVNPTCTEVVLWEGPGNGFGTRLSSKCDFFGLNCCTISCNLFFYPKKAKKLF